MNWQLDIYRVLYDLIRPNYALTNAVPAHGSNPGKPREFNILYKFLAACLYPLRLAVERYNYVSKKMYALASNDGTNIAVAGYLDKYYGTGVGFKAVKIKSAFKTSSVNLYPQTYTPQTSVSFYPQTFNGGANDVSLRPDSGNLGWAEITVDRNILSNMQVYDNLVADINALLKFGLQYELNYY